MNPFDRSSSAAMEISSCLKNSTPAAAQFYGDAVRLSGLSCAPSLGGTIRTREKAFRYRACWVECDFSGVDWNEALQRRRRYELGALSSIRYNSGKGARLAFGFLGFELTRKGVVKGIRMGWIDDEQIVEESAELGSSVEKNYDDDYVSLGTEVSKKGINDLWASQAEGTDLESTRIKISRGIRSDLEEPRAGLANSKLSFERKPADGSIRRELDGGPVSGGATRRDYEGNSIERRSYRSSKGETVLEETESAVRRDSPGPLSFRSSVSQGNNGATDTRNFNRGVNADDNVEDRNRPRRDDFRSGRNSRSTEDLYDGGKGDLQRRPGEMNTAEIRADENRSINAVVQEKSGRDLAGGRTVSLKRGSEDSFGEKRVEEGKEELVASVKGETWRRASIVDSRRTLKRSKMIAKQIISQSSALALGFVSQLWVNARLLEVVALEVRPSLLSGQVDGVLINDVCQVGDVILVRDESSLESELNVLDCEALVGCDLLTEDGYYLGKVRDYSFNLLDGNVTSLEFDSLGFSLVPSNLISTYWLAIEEVAEVSSDSLLVKSGAESRVRRLTKGIWPLPNLEAQVRTQRVGGIQRSKKRFSVNQDVSGGKQMGMQARRLPPRNGSRFPLDSQVDGLDVRSERISGGKQMAMRARSLPPSYGSRFPQGTQVDGIDVRTDLISGGGKQMGTQARRLPPRNGSRLPQDTQVDGLDVRIELGDRRWLPMDYGSSDDKS